MLDAVQNTIWTQRILKEEAVNCSADPKGFSIRAAMGVTDVPARFKVGQMDPQEAMRAPQTFDPATVGWDPQGAEVREFRRNYDAQTAGPRTRHAYPETASHELGWLLAPRGNMAERVERRKMRMGFGWPAGPPASFSEVSAAHPVGDRSEVSAAGPSQLSAAGPSELSRMAPADAPRGGAASELSRAGASQVSACSGSHISAVKYARHRSMPALGKAAAVKRLARHEEEIEGALGESRGYLNKGPIGHRWTKFLNGTDVTDFDNEFTRQNGGVPLYKMASR